MIPLQRNWIIGLVLAAAVLAGGIYAIHRHASSASPAPGGSASTTTQTIDGLTITGPGGATVSIDTSVPAPDYHKPVAFASSVPQNTRTAVNAALVQVQAALAKDPHDFNSWVSLGTLYKVGGDYPDALAIWNYVSQAWPTNIVTPLDLGDLYANFLHDYAKAEADYKLAIQRAAADTNAYRDLFQLYTQTSYKPSGSAAENVLKQGIAAAPQAVDLHVLLARYFVLEGRTADAKAQFDAAISSAQSQGQTSLASQIQAEEAALK